MNVKWTDDTELFELMRKELFTAVVGDVMDGLGLRSQFLPPYLAPLERSMIIAGRAMTVLEADVHDERPEVYVCTGSSPAYALWGGLMSIRALQLGAAGAVLDGYVRDSREIISLGLPLASRGCYAQDQGPRGKVIDYRIPISMGQVRIDSGDILFGDCDGVLAIPRAREREVIEGAIDKVRGESRVRKALEGGMSTVEAFDTFGIM